MRFFYSALAFSSLVLLAIQARGQSFDDVENLHPSWSLSQLRPNAWKIQVGGMAFLPDGKLLIVEHVEPNEQHSGIPLTKGRLWVIDNPNATGEAIKYRQIADQLKDPIGVMVLNGKVIVSEKTELTEWTLDAGVTKATKSRTIATIPHDKSGDVNFQEYAFGLLYKDGYFYVSAGGAVKSGGLSFDGFTNQLDQEKVGGVLKIKDSDGSVTLMNGGMRACNGIAWGPEGTLWQTDNQGSYRPSSQLTAVVEGANYGYPNKTNAFSSKPITLPSIWMVHGDIARSPSFPHLVEKGIYAGQFVVGDLGQGGIKRAFVEKVEGAWQGAVFSFTGGLEVGIEKILEDSNGVLYVGGMGRGDANNWGWNTTKFGLQKLTPKSGSITFEMLAIRSRRTGIEIEFTKPVGSSASNASSYSVNSAEMQYVPGYGEGNMLRNGSLSIKSVTVSSDKRKVFLELNNLTAKRVLTVKVQGVRSETGETPRLPAGWYTLNAISQTDAFLPTSIDPSKPALASSDAIRTRFLGAGLQVAIPFNGDHTVTLLDLQGRPLAQRRGTGAQEYTFSQISYHHGLYLIQIQVDGSLFNKAVSF